MKIICIGRNYADHAKELNSPVPTVPVFFMKPESALVYDNKPVYYPDFTKEFHYETEIVVKISRLGKNIEERFANRYYDEIGIGIDFTARDIQRDCIKNGLPWEISKSFDNSAPLGKFVSKTQFADLQNINFHLKINNEIRQSGNTKDMIFSIDRLISYVSQFNTLKIGDLIFTGTPVGVGPVKIDDRLQAFIENDCLLDFNVK
jgi:2-keto-4-pentenoate hydratase/2-oxohepta-3-ene-1,7-dioic acid hydratase in catechol pathway